MVIAMIDTENDCSFAVKIANDAAKDKAEEYMQEGLRAWFCATDPESYDKDYFTKEEVEGFYWCGYAEPTSELLDKNGIEHEVIDIERDENGKVTNADVVFCY